MRYASQTQVSTERSRGEIEKHLLRYGATGFFYGWQSGRAVVGFEMQGHQVRVDVPLPEKSAPEFHTTPQGRRRKPKAAHEAWEQALRQRYRALSLVILAKLEAVESGVATFQQEFLAHLVLPSGETVGQYVTPRLDAISAGQGVPLLPGKVE